MPITRAYEKARWTYPKWWFIAPTIYIAFYVTKRNLTKVQHMQVIG